MRSGLDIHNDIVSMKTFESWAYSGVGTKDKMNKDNYIIELVHLDEGTHVDSYGNIPQGWRGIASMVFKVTQRGEDGDFNTFYEKIGTVSSYSDISWDGIFIRVNPKSKEVITYEFE